MAWCGETLHRLVNLELVYALLESFILQCLCLELGAATIQMCQQLRHSAIKWAEKHRPLTPQRAPETLAQAPFSARRWQVQENER